MMKLRDDPEKWSKGYWTPYRKPSICDVRTRTTNQVRRADQWQKLYGDNLFWQNGEYHISLLFSNLSTGLRSTNTFNMNFSLTYKVLTTSQPSCLNNLISVQPPRSTHSSSVVTLSRPPTISSLKITDRSFRYASPHLWNQLPDSFTCQLISIVITTVVIHHSFTLGSKPTFSTNPSHLRFLLPTGLPSWQRKLTGPITLIVLFLVSHFNFLFVPCGRLSKLATRQLFTACYIHTHYHK